MIEAVEWLVVVVEVEVVDAEWRRDGFAWLAIWRQSAYARSTDAQISAKLMEQPSAGL
jgi:hypothetical protein